VLKLKKNNSGAKRLTRFWSTQTIVESIVLKAAWHWGSDSNVVNDPFGEPDHTPLYVGLLSVWGCVDCDRMFSPYFMGRLLLGDTDRYKLIKKPLALGTERLSP